MTQRPLTPGEIKIARSVFGDAIDYAPVRVAHSKWWPLQPRETLMSPCGHVHVHPASTLWSDDYSAEKIELQGLLMHELTHVLQAQERGRWYLPLMRHPFCRYGYAIRPGQTFDEYGLEQQGELIRHVFFARNHRALPGMASPEELESIVAPRFTSQPPAPEPSRKWHSVHIGFANDGVTIGGLDVWKEKWRPIAARPLQLPHPAYPNQTHYYDIYEIGPPGRPVRFAAGELSNGVWGFYVPDGA